MADKKWLEPSMESEEQKAARRRLAKEQHMSLADLEAALEAEQKKAKQPRQKIAKAPEPKPLWPDVQPNPTVQPDRRLAEIAKMWPSLNERDRDEMVMMLRVKIHLNRQALGK